MQKSVILVFVAVLSAMPLLAQSGDSSSVTKPSSRRTWTLSELDTLSTHKWVWRDSTFKDPVLNTDDSIPERLPRLLKRVAYEFPQRSPETELRPDVILRVLIDKKGNVRAYYVRKDSGLEESDFEDIALLITYKSVWEPAYFRNKPVAAWVTHICKFRSVVVKYDEPVLHEGVNRKWWVVEEEPSTQLAARLPDELTPAKPATDSTLFQWSDSLPIAMNLVQPIYPVNARFDGIEASVWVEVLVNKQGDVPFAMIFTPSKHPKEGFEGSALHSAIQGKWKPATLQGKPVSVWVSYEIKYLLRSREESHH